MNDRNPDTSAPKDEEGNNAQRIREACLDHATDLVESAERVLRDNGYPNIAYHLAILALEEIGKAGMIGSRAVIGTARDTNWIERKLDDHVSKLQWAIWSPRLGGRIDPKDFEEARRFAQSTHARRLAGLYVNSEAGTATAPRLAVAREQANSVINLARARLEVERVEASHVYDKSNENLKWFLDTMGDELGASRMLSKPFIAKYEEFKGDTNAWVIWARREFEKIASDEQAHLKKELARSPSAPENSKPKWVIRIRLYTPSHTIRPKILNFWNNAMDRVKLIHVGKKNELLLELTIDDSVPALNLYDTGFSMSKLCIASLNVGSLGYFWYDLPRQTSHYYESIRDIDAPMMDFAVNNATGVSVDWKPGALTEKHLWHAIQFITAYGHMPDQKAEPIFGPYLRGLVLLSKADIHLACEHQARDAFVETLRSAIKHFGDWDGNNDTFLSSLHRVFNEIIPEEDHRNQLFNILSHPETTAERNVAGAMNAKRLTDLYLVLVADRLWSKRESERRKLSEQSAE